MHEMEREKSYHCCWTLEMLLRSSATVANAGSGEWWKAWRHWARGWTIVAARRPACGTGSPKPTPCSTRRKLCSVIPNCWSKGVFTPSRRVYQLRYAVLLNGLHTVNVPGFAHLGIGKASSSPVPAQETERVLG